MGLKYVYVEYDPARPVNCFDLDVRELVHTIELTRFVYDPLPGLP